ncbi:hypothetical protein OKW38_000177 [Paraburkholderia sp. MM5496-R1]|uniref:Uncharacterized protein n=1 Tax=Paraburkholderia tuberum TaxID=157910 RepID=A0A1H1KCQ2_9BURK|nr:hypothetical protein [Paraburkholderia tuberum]SDR60111.1 hypothetical protein SAMN05445850_7136 [Paraburkholderia tuberum]
MGLILLIAGVLTTSAAGYHYVAYPDRDVAIQAAYYLGQSAGMGNEDSQVKFDERFHGDKDARLAYEHGMKSVEPPGNARVDIQ